MNNAEKIPFSVDISRMIEVLAAQIYPSPFALLRENVQNSFDAILIRKFLGHQFEPRIDLTIEPDRIRVVDNGVGMSRDNLRTHFWKAGSSSKNTADARAAGVVGTFGIGAMANFGIAEELVVVSESSANGERTRCRAQRSTLSVTENCIDFDPLPSLGIPGTEIIAEMQSGKTVNVAEAVNYISSFVAYLQIDVFVNEVLVSRKPIEEAVSRLVETWRTKEVAAELSPGLKADVELTGAVNGEVRIDLSSLQIDDKPVEGRLILRQGIGNLRTFRSRFGLATASVSSLYGFGGVADFLFLQPTAGREALTTESLQALQRVTTPIDQYVSLRSRNARRPIPVRLSFLGRRITADGISVASSVCGSSLERRRHCRKLPTAPNRGPCSSIREMTRRRWSMPRGTVRWSLCPGPLRATASKSVISEAAPRWRNSPANHRSFERNKSPNTAWRSLHCHLGFRPSFRQTISSTLISDLARYRTACRC